MHTPGPWKMNQNYTHGIAINHGENGRITFLFNHVEYNGKSCGSISSQDKTKSEIISNAKLIAAAPTMYDALTGVQQLLNILIESGIDKTGRISFNLETVSNAIKKATD